MSRRTDARARAPQQIVQSRQVDDEAGDVEDAQTEDEDQARVVPVERARDLRRRVVLADLEAERNDTLREQRDDIQHAAHPGVPLQLARRPHVHRGQPVIKSRGEASPTASGTGLNASVSRCPWVA